MSLSGIPSPLNQATHSPPASMADLEPQWFLPGSLPADLHESYRESRRRALHLKYGGAPSWQLS